MNLRSLAGRPRKPLSPEVRYLVSMFWSAAIMTAIAATLVVVTGGLPPRLHLVGPTWQWVGSGVPGATPAVVADPAAYAVRFGRDRSLLVTADCATVAGRYRVLPAGRAGGAVNSLTVELDPAAPPACGNGSLAGVFVEQLAAARTYAIDGTRLTIVLTSGEAMSLEGAAASEDRTPGGQP